MKKKLNQILAKLEKIEENQTGQLTGGFTSFTNTNNEAMPAYTNNCKSCGGNEKGDGLNINNCAASNCFTGCGESLN